MVSGVQVPEEAPFFKSYNGSLEKRLNSHAFHACIHGFESRTNHHIESIGLIQIVSDLFSLRIGTFILSATKFQSLVEVSNDIFMRLFFFLDIATERKPYQRDDRCCYGTIDFAIYYYKKILAQ